MFTRYQGMKLPDNYGGSRFVQNSAPETQTKTHRPNVYKAVKTTHSPAFEEARKDNNTLQIHNQDEQNQDDKNDIKYNQATEEPQKNSSEENGQNIGNAETETENKTLPPQFSNLPPFYNGTLYSEQYQDENINDTSYLEQEFGMQEKVQNSDDEEAFIESDEKTGNDEKAKNEEHNLQKNLGFSKLGELFGKIESDELLLLCIILLISGDSKHENNDILPILSLLLLNKK